MKEKSGDFKYVEPIVSWDTPCLLMFYECCFAIEEQSGGIEKRVNYKDSRWIKAPNYIICISDPILVKDSPKEILNLLSLQ